jgi:hypothetical protein
MSVKEYKPQYTGKTTAITEARMMAVILVALLCLRADSLSLNISLISWEDTGLTE